MQLHSLLRTALLGAAVFTAGQAAAAVSVTKVTDTLTNLELTFNWDQEISPTPNNVVQQSFNYLSNNWSVKGILNAFKAGQLLTVNANWSGLHLGQPHATDSFAEQALGSLFFVATNGVPSSAIGDNITVAVPHNNGHSDIYHFQVNLPASGIATSATLTAVHAVPEPESYAMLLAGIGVVGWRLRQRRNSI
ncbi:MAG: PEP-CTERM sorting domain-containing protein [Chitinivorax sp.]